MKNYRRFLILIFFSAICLRIGLAFVNRYANDNHIDVINIIVDKNRIPEKDECWSCYQPKLYYLVSAGFIELLNYKMPHKRIVVSQLVNVVFAFLILLLFWKFLEKPEINSQFRLLLFAFFALNPCLAAINIQGTNDTLVILCGTATIFFADAFFKTGSRRQFLWMTLSLIAAGLTKATGIILFGALIIVFILKILAQNERLKRLVMVRYFGLFMAAVLVVVPFAGGYYTNYKKYDSLTLSTWKKDSPPNFFEPTLIGRPGTTDMFHAWFTFRYVDLVRTPFITNEFEPNALHRTSLWSQLYGRTMFLHFDQWPQKWQTQNPYILTIGSVLMLLGIVPLLLFLKGLFSQMLKFLKPIFTCFQAYLRESKDYLHMFVAIGFLLSSVYYSYHIRDFSAMKSIYIFPAMASYIKLIADGYISIKQRLIYGTIKIVLLIICLLFVIDLLYLFYQLYLDRIGLR